MIYNRTTWENSPSTSTPINAQNLNKIEQGITDAANEINAISHIVNVGTEVEEDYRVNFIHSRNLWKQLPNTQTLNGITLTNNGNGTFNLSGTATANTSLYVELDLGSTNLKNGTYTLSKKSVGYNIQLDFYSGTTYVSTPIYCYGSTLENSATLSIGSNVNKIRYIIYVANGSSVSLTNEEIMLNSGNEALPYEPYNISNQIVVDNETFTDTIKVSNEVDGKSRVNVLKSENLFDASIQAGTYGTATYSVASDGLITQSATDSSSMPASDKRNFKLKKGTYTASIIGKPSNVNFQMRNITTSSNIFEGVNNSYTFTLTNDSYVAIKCWSASATYPISYYVMLNKGSNALDYEPYNISNQIVVDNETFSETIKIGNEVDDKSRVNIIHSKNLLPNNSSTTTTNGITFTKNSDGSITINGTSTGRADLYIFDGTTNNSYLKIKKGTYSFDRRNLTNGKIFFAFREKTAGTTYETLTNNSALELMATQDCYFYRVMLGIESGNTINNLTIYPMLNEGSEALPYEPYIQNQIVVDNETFTDTLKVGTNVDGKSRVNVLKSKNLFTSEVEQGAINANVGSTYVNVKSSNATRIRTTDLIRLDKTKSYTISCKTDYNVVLQAFNDNQLLYVVDGTTNTWVSSKTFSNIPYIAISIKKSDNSNITPSEINNAEVMLEVGTSASTYEDYIVPSINVDGETFTDTLKVGTDVDSRSRVNVLKSTNLFDLDYYYNNCNTNNCTKEKTTTGIKLSFTAGLDAFVGWAGKSGFTLPDEAKRILIPVKPNTNYTISLSTSTRNSTYITYVTSDYSVINSSYQPISDKYTWTFTTPVNCKYIVLRFGARDNSITTYTFADIRLNEGSEVLPYQPYTPPSINVDGEEIYNSKNKDILNDLASQIKYIYGTNTGNSLTFSFTNQNASKKCYVVVASKGNTDGTFGGMWFIRTGATAVGTIVNTGNNATLNATISGDTVTCTFSGQGNYSYIRVYQVLSYD